MSNLKIKIVIALLIIITSVTGLTIYNKKLIENNPPRMIVDCPEPYKDEYYNESKYFFCNGTIINNYQKNDGLENYLNANHNIINMTNGRN